MSGLNAKKKTQYPTCEWCVWYDFGVYDMISVEKNDRECRDCTLLSGVLSSYIQYGAIIVRYLGTFRNCYWWAIRNS